MDAYGEIILDTVLQGDAVDKIIAMAGTLDHSGAAVLAISYIGESALRLYDIPEFNSRGVLMPVRFQLPLSGTLNRNIFINLLGYLCCLHFVHSRHLILGPSMWS